MLSNLRLGGAEAHSEESHFWRLSADLQQALHDKRRRQRISELVDELEVVALNTESPAIRDRCTALITSAKPHCRTVLALVRPWPSQ